MANIRLQLTTKKNHSRVPSDWYETSVRTNLLQRFWHYQRIKQVFLTAPTNITRLLDVGCADGFLTYQIQQATKANHITGIDFLPSSIAYAKNRYQKYDNFTFKTAPAESLPFRNSSFDAVYALEIIEHLASPKQFTQEAYRVLRNSGYFICIIPTENLLFRLIWCLWKQGKGRIWTDTHLNVFTPKQLVGNLQSIGFTNIELHYFLLNMLLLIKCQK